MRGGDDFHIDLAPTLPRYPSIQTANREKTAPAAVAQEPAPKPIERRLWFHLALALASFATFALITYHLGKDVGFDLLNYHFYNGFALFTGAWQRNIIPAQTQSFFNPEADVLTYLLIAYLPPAAAGMIMGGLQGLNFWFVFTVASYLIRFPKGAAYSWLQWPVWFACAALALYSPAAVSEFGTYMQDLFTAIFVTAGVALALAGLYAADRPGRATLLMSLAGLSLGFAAGLKLTNVPFAVGAALCLLPTTVSKRGVLQLLVSYVAVAAGFVAGAGYWSWNLWVRYRNPFFLSFNKVFKSPYAQAVNVNDPRFFPTTRSEKLFYPFYFRVNTPAFPLELSIQDYSVALCYILFFIVLAVGAVRLVSWATNRNHADMRLAPAQATSQRIGNTPWKRITDMVSDTAALSNPTQLTWRFAGFYAVSFVLWEIVFSNYRYLTPLILLSPVFIASAVFWLVRERVVTSFITLVLFAAVALTSVHADWGRTQDWGTSYFGVQAPALQDPSHSMVLMNTGFIDAYLIPEFPHSVTFVRIESGDMRYYTPKFNAIMAQDIASHQGPMYMLTMQTPDMASTTVMIAHANQTLTPYNLQIVPGSCQLIPASIYAAPQYFCTVQHMPNKR